MDRAARTEAQRRFAVNYAHVLKTIGFVAAAGAINGLEQFATGHVGSPLELLHGEALHQLAMAAAGGALLGVWGWLKMQRPEDAKEFDAQRSLLIGR
jgi:hypothetical protein